MIHTLAIENYRSLLNLVMPLGNLNVISGPNACGKSNLYRALRLLSETTQGGVINALAREGGLDSTFWAGPEKLTGRMQREEVQMLPDSPAYLDALKTHFGIELDAPYEDLKPLPPDGGEGRPQIARGIY